MFLPYASDPNADVFMFQCDGKVPSCSPCYKHRVVCDMTNHVMYSFETVQKLRSRIQFLEAQVQQFRGESDVTESLPNKQKRMPQMHLGHMRNTLEPNSATADAVSEEVGNLALGSMNHMSHKYGA